MHFIFQDVFTRIMNMATAFSCILKSYILTEVFKAADTQMLKKTITVNTGQVMFSGEIYYYWPLNSVDKIVGKTSFFFA